MTTPNMSQSSNKHPQSYAAHAVSTPNHHFMNTPGGSTATPRSVPSPAIPRSGGTASGLSAKPSSSSVTGTPQNVGNKQPFASQGGAAMAPSLSQMSNASNSSQPGGSGAIGLGVSGGGLMGASPANLLSFASPAALAGMDIGTPSVLLGGEGGQAMNISFSDMGMSSRRGNEDEERRAKLESVLAKLHGRSKGRDDPERPSRLGRVSEEGVRRVGCLVGMDIDTEMKEKKHEGNRPMTIAGKSAVLIDLSFKNNLPTKVDVSFFSEDPAVEAHQEAAGKVLMADLQPPLGVATINTSLDRFAANLETIAKLDKLSVAGELNCFEAITGVYTSLQRLYEEEKRAALALFEAKEGLNQEIMGEKEVICKRSGRPRMHARRKIGLSVEYWNDGQKSSKLQAPVKDKGEMEVDTVAKISHDSSEGDDKGTYALYLTAESNDPNVYPSLRTSNTWISERIYVPSAETTSPSALLSGNPSIDWQDPLPTYLGSSNDNMDAMNVDGQQQHKHQKLPAARFVAKLDPPLAMPWTVANNILQSVGAQAGTDVDILQTYASILLRRAASNMSTSEASPQNNTLGTLGGVTTVASSDNNVVLKSGEDESRQRRELWVPKQEFGYVLRSIPFAHPRQIVQVLPVLRQWARVGSLLQHAFLPDDASLLSGVYEKKEDQKSNGLFDGKLKTQERKKFTLAELLTPPPSSPEENEDVEMGEADNGPSAGTSQRQSDEVLAIDFSLTTSPSPALDIVFPLPSLESGLASVSISILENGEVAVLGQNIVQVDNKQMSDSKEEADAGNGGNTGEEAQKKIRQIGRALEVVGDLGIWVEWLRKRFA